MTVTLVTRFPVDDAELSALHTLAFGSDPAVVTPWASRLTRHALTWVGAFSEARLVGFVQVCWDGGAHAFLLDTVVSPDHQHGGVGSALVATAVAETRAGGCEWLHVDFEPHLQPFYLNRCGFHPTAAGLIRL